jgi:ribose transport system substrate-binding protein
VQALQVTENLLQSYPQIDGILAANDSMALGAIEALDGAKRKALVVGINGTKEAIDAIKAGKLLATGDCDGFAHGCLGTMAAVRHLRNLPVPKEFIFSETVIDSTNYVGLDVPYEQRMCPSWRALLRTSSIRDSMYALCRKIFLKDSRIPIEGKSPDLKNLNGSMLGRFEGVHWNA